MMFDKHRAGLRQCIGAKVEANRVKKEISRKKLGELVGADSAMVRKWELGENIPSTYSIDRLCDALEISPNELFGWDGE